MTGLPEPQSSSSAVVIALLPGPDRKRRPRRYVYRLSYRNPEPAAVGCVLTWEVSGGRLSYQVALERDERGNLRLHCTCADAVFRAADEGRFCKHLRGLLGLGAPDLRPGEPAPVGLGA